MLALKIDFQPGFTPSKEIVIGHVENFIGVSEMFTKIWESHVISATWLIF